MPEGSEPADSERSGGGKVSRRRLLTAGAGAGTALALGIPNLACGGDRGHQRTDGREGGEGSLIPPGRRGLQLYSIRDAIGRDPDRYPTLPTGFRRVFAALAEIGYANVEGFDEGSAPFRQHPSSEGGAEPSARLIKGWMDEYGLRAAGHYGKIGPSTIDATLALAETLETPLVGSVDPIPYPCSNQKADWDVAIEEWNACAARAAARGIRIYAHAHWRPWEFLRDSGPKDARGNLTRSSGIRSMEYWLDNTDPRWVALEMDTYWAYVARSLYRTYTAPDGTTRHDEFDPIATALKYGDRCPVFHAKDGVASASPPAGFEGDWTWTTFNSGDMPVEELFRAVMKKRPPGEAPYLNVEQDNGPSGIGRSLAEPITDPAKSLRDAKTNHTGLVGMSA